MSAIRRITTVLVVSILLAACQEDGATGDQTDAAILDVLSPQRAACEKSGGRWGSVPGSDARYVCYRTTRDANRSCSTARDCEGLCLARSRTCAPATPFFGCHEVLSSNGTRQTLCIE